MTAAVDNTVTVTVPHNYTLWRDVLGTLFVMCAETGLNAFLDERRGLWMFDLDGGALPLAGFWQTRLNALRREAGL